MYLSAKGFQFVKFSIFYRHIRVLSLYYTVFLCSQLYFISHFMYENSLELSFLTQHFLNNCIGHYYFIFRKQLMPSPFSTKRRFAHLRKIFRFIRLAPDNI